ncbi:unnamed protein product [Linum tenue]|uniref:Protein kinase domain-containing protein n=1 Tax=Linum tenue TaxID=586396 RepID=A0AAV0QGA1_9ROSI|nr:unnamed protein product [Linum tenue]
MKDVIRKLRPRLLSWLHRSGSAGRIALFVRRFSYKEVKKATDEFRRVMYSNPDGVSAYKAKLEDGEVVLVKEVKFLDHEENSSDGEFYRQVQLLARLHHRHLLAVRGFSAGRKRYLVFDNIENGSLKEHLDDPLRTPLDWRTRLQIAIGVAAALEYLLHFSDPPMYSVSISSSNIMLDQNFNVKVADISVHTSSTNSSALILHSSDSEGSDELQHENIIFQLGLLILELVTGQSSVKGCTDLVQWIQECSSSSSFHRMIDPDLGDRYDSSELRKLLAVARVCIRSRYEPKFSIQQIFRYLQKKVENPYELTYE